MQQVGLKNTLESRCFSK